MANVIKCPVCSENNSSDQEFCQFCQSRLQPVAGSLSTDGEGFKPGQAPTSKVTSDLEPILPQWLRDARSSARNAAEDDLAQFAQPAQDSSHSSASHDLLAGLQAQSGNDDDEDTPDWLASITGTAPKTKTPQSDSSEVRWVELGGAKDFKQEESAAENETPSWLANLAPTGAPSVEKDELTDWMREASGIKPQPSQSSIFETPDWLRKMGTDSAERKEEPTSFNSANSTADIVNPTPAASDTPDWLRQMAADSDANSAASFDDSSNTFNTTPADADTPDWLRSMGTDADAQNSAASFDDSSNTFNTTPADADTPDWLRSIGTDVDAQNSAASFNAPSADSDTPDWLRSIGSQDQGQSADSAGFSETGFGESDASSSSAGDTPDWLKGFGSESSSPALSSDDDWLKSLQTEKNESPMESEAPAWLKAGNAAVASNAGMELPAWQTEPAQEDEPVAFAREEVELGDVPSWLKAAAPHSSIYGEETTKAKTPDSVAASDTPPDWLNAFKSFDTPQQVPTFAEKEEAVEAAPPAFVPDSQPAENMDALFTDMPDWLTSSADVPSALNPAPTPIINSDVLATGELPAWVQAMRPVDTGVSQLSSASLSSDQTLEARGALAGLQGVLPAAPGYAPTSKPKAYSIKLQASDEQQTHAALLEQILAAETEPVPITSYSALRTSRVLRWALAFILIGVITTVLALRTQIFSMPVGNTLEISGALQTVGALPESAPVLVAFDYEPARVGEMEAVAAPLFDQMLVLRHPRLTFISTHETGAILAERFITGPLAGHSYQSGIQYLNLGYLPGGQMGIRAFAQDPSVAAPYAFTQNSTFINTSLTSAWGLPPLEGVTSLLQFAAIIIVTDNADSARAWIEQTTSARGATPIVVISSAQSAPMIQPYYASQQIAGLVSGLYGGAVYEQNNAGRPGTARTYWDAYSIGMLLAMAIILGGGLWNFALGVRDRAAAREAK